MVTAAMREHEGLISGEVLATAYAEGEPEAGDHIGADPELGLAFGLHRA
jgi:hypothetical protein